MNTFKKVGLTALGTSLIATSAFSADLAVTGGASITFAGTSGNATGNGFTMNDEITFSGSGEMDNGWTVSVSMQLDNNAEDASAESTFDNRSITIGMGDMGTLSFVGHGGSAAMGNVDDMTPAVYGESWDILPAGDKGVATPAGAIASATDDNSWFYTNSSLMDGLSVSLSYVPASSREAQSSTDWAVAYTGIDGLTIGFAQGEDNSSSTTANHLDLTTAYVVYAYGPVTVGYQASEADGSTTALSDDFTAVGVTYAVSEDLSIGYNESTYDFGDQALDQENTALGFSYTTGGMTISGAMVEESNRNGSSAAVNDVEGYEVAVSFAF
jgi:outer membrane protein OmpU